jgi:hypothetical protein
LVEFFKGLNGKRLNRRPRVESAHLPHGNSSPLGDETCDLGAAHAPLAETHASARNVLDTVCVGAGQLGRLPDLSGTHALASADDGFIFCQHVCAILDGVGSAESVSEASGDPQVAARRRGNSVHLIHAKTPSYGSSCSSSNATFGTRDVGSLYSGAIAGDEQVGNGGAHHGVSFGH